MRGIKVKTLYGYYFFQPDWSNFEASESTMINILNNFTTWDDIKHKAKRLKQPPEENVITGKFEIVNIKESDLE
jgi:hypothetical protein